MQGMEEWGARTRPCYNSICYSLRYHMVLYFKTPPPPPPQASSCVACFRCPPSTARRPPPAIHCLLLLQNLWPNLVNCCPCHRPLSFHHLPLRHLTHRIIRRSPSTRRHCHRHHCCNPLLTLTALVALSASHYLLSSRCLPAAAIVAATPSLLRLLSSRLPPPAPFAPSYRQCYNTAPAIVAVTP